VKYSWDIAAEVFDDVMDLRSERKVRNQDLGWIY